MDLKSLLLKHEGLKLKAYQDTKGIWTIGCGRNLEDVGITQQEAMYLLDNDIRRIINDCWHEFPWFGDLSEERQYVVIDMIFNVGLAGFKKFVKFIAAVQKEDWQEAARQIINSQIAANRAAELATIMRGPVK
jgi:lysozyme